MLWRQPYVTPLFRGVQLPEPLPDRLSGLLVLLSEDSLPEAELWRRLFASELSQVALGFTLAGAPTVATMENLLPRSLHNAIRLSGAEWGSLVPVDGSKRVIALLGKGEVAEVIAVGPPTEDAWELFVAVASESAASAP